MNILNYKSHILKDERSGKLIFRPDGRNYYVYRITDLSKSKHYYGSRVTKLKPHEDLGIKYFSSSSDKEFLIEQKQNPDNFKYKIIKIFDNPGDSTMYESYLHQYFSVCKSNDFINKSNQTPYGFTITGNKEIGKKISDAHNEIQESGLTLSQEHINIRKNKIQESGLTINQERGIKMSKILNTVQESGLTLAQESGIKSSKTFKTIQESGLTLSKEQALKRRGKYNGAFKGYYVLNNIYFNTSNDADKFSNMSSSAIRNWCNNCDSVISKTTYNRSKYLQSLFKWDNSSNITFKDINIFFVHV